MKKIIYIFIITVAVIFTGCTSDKNEVPKDIVGEYTVNTKKIEFGGNYELGKVIIIKKSDVYSINLNYKVVRNKIKQNGQIKSEKTLIEKKLKLQGKISKVEYSDKDFEENSEVYVIAFDPETIKLAGTKEIVDKFKVSPQFIFIRKAKVDGQITELLKINGGRYKKVR